MTLCTLKTLKKGLWSTKGCTSILALFTPDLVTFMYVILGVISFVLKVIFQYPIIFGGAPQDPAKLEKINEAMKFLDIFLAGGKYVAGDNITVADLTIVATVSTLEVVGYDLTPYKNVSRSVTSKFLSKITKKGI